MMKNLNKNHPLDNTLDLNTQNYDEDNGFFGVTPDAEFEPLEEPVYEEIPEVPVEPVPPRQEVENLAEALAEDAPTYVDESGAIHLQMESGVDTENMLQVDGNIFGAPTAEDDEVQRLANAMYNDSGDGYWVDEYGRIRLDSEPVTSENMTKVDGNIFGGLTEEEELQRLADALYGDNNDGEIYVNENGEVCSTANGAVTENMTKLDGNIFGAHEDQWYSRNPRLFNAEVKTMRTHYPKAAYSFYNNNGNMFWIVTLNIFQNKNITKPWQFQLVYDKDHPNNHGFGGSIKVVPLKPSLDELRTIATRHGRPGVPHVIYNDSHFLKRYLCTRWPKDIADGSEIVASATQAAAWAADWAAHFEVGLRDKKVWNKWCDDDHFRHLMVK